MKLTNSRCQCASCGRCFSSTSAFDKHRAWADKDGVRHTGRGARTREFDYRVCINPEAAGLVERKGVFAFPPSPSFNAATDEYGQTAFDVQRSRKRFDRMYLRPVDPELREAARARAASDSFEFAVAS